MQSSKLLSGWVWRGAALLAAAFLLAVLVYAVVRLIAVLSSGVQV